MKFKQTYEFETLFVRVLVFVVAFWIAIVALSSCTSSKKVNKEITEEKKVVTVDSVAKVKSDSTKVSLEENLKTSDNTIEFFHPFDFMVDTSGCPTVEPKIIYKPDGSFEATGVKKVNLKTTEWQKKYDSLNNEYNLEINKRMTLEQELKSKTVVKDVERRPVAVAWFLFLVIGFITGLLSKHKLK